MDKFLSNVIAYITGCVLGLFLAHLGLLKCSDDKVISHDHLMALDSLKTASMSVTIDSLNTEIELNNKKIDSLTKMRTNAYVVYRTAVESVSDSHECDSVVDACDELVENLEESINEMNLKIDNMDSISVVKDSIIETKNITIGKLNDNTIRLNNELAKKDNWWNRNKFVIGVVGGAIVATIGGVSYAGR